MYQQYQQHIEKLERLVGMEFVHNSGGIVVFGVSYSGDEGDQPEFNFTAVNARVAEMRMMHGILPHELDYDAETQCMSFKGNFIAKKHVVLNGDDFTRFEQFIQNPELLEQFKVCPVDTKLAILEKVCKSNMESIRSYLQPDEGLPPTQAQLLQAIRNAWRKNEHFRLGQLMVCAWVKTQAAQSTEPADMFSCSDLTLLAELQKL